MADYLGSQKVSRSAYAVQEATPTTIYLGVCERDDRPVRFEMPADLGAVAEIPCFAGCTLPVRCERLHAVTTTLECDGSCRSARRPDCSCGCGGINHGNIWTRGALLDLREVVDSEVEKYRAGQRKTEIKREARREAAARRVRSAFATWAAGHQDVITALEPHRPDDLGYPQPGGNDFLADLARQIFREHNPKPLSDGQMSAALRVIARQAARRSEEAERNAAARPSPEGTKIPVNGEIVKIKVREGYMRGTLQHQAIVKCDGYAVQVTLPQALQDWAWANRHDVITDPDGWRRYRDTPDYHGIGERWTQALRGTRLAFTAGEVKRWERDETLGFAKRPTQVTFTPPEPEPDTGTEREAS